MNKEVLCSVNSNSLAGIDMVDFTAPLMTSMTNFGSLLIGRDRQSMHVCMGSVQCVCVHYV